MTEQEVFQQTIAPWGLDPEHARVEGFDGQTVSLNGEFRLMDLHALVYGFNAARDHREGMPKEPRAVRVTVHYEGREASKTLLHSNVAEHQFRQSAAACASMAFDQIRRRRDGKFCL